MAFIVPTIETGTSEAFTNIGVALDDRLENMIGVPPVAWENRNYEPVEGTLYLRATRIPGDTDQAGLGDSGEDYHDGIYQVDVFAPAGEWKQEALAMADKVANRFNRGSKFGHNGVYVRIRKASIGASYTKDGWYQIPVFISYYSITQAR